MQLAPIGSPLHKRRVAAARPISEPPRRPLRRDAVINGIGQAQGVSARKLRTAPTELNAIITTAWASYSLFLPLMNALI